MANIKLFVLGAPYLTIDGQVVEIPRRKALALLIYLAVSGEPQRRDTLATLLWPDDSQRAARAALSRHLSELRKIIGTDWLSVDQDIVALADGLWLDHNQFQQGVVQSAHSDPITVDAFTAIDMESDVATSTPNAAFHAEQSIGIEGALALYRGDFLAGFTLPDCPAFDEWQFFQGEELRQQFATALEQMIQTLVERGTVEAALPHARRWLALDPLHEPAHQTLMRLYAESGQQAAALRQYQLCVQTLEEELGVPPAEETTALYEQIRTGPRSQGLKTQESNKHRLDLPQPAASVLPTVRYDWRDAPTVEQIYGREGERQQLTNWLVGEHCRLISVLGIGGLGKTTLVAQVVRDLATRDGQPFARIFWRSLLNAPPLAELLPDILHFLALPQSVVFPENLDKRLTLLSDYVTHERVLLVFDNLESIMDAGVRAGHYRAGYEDYGQLFHSFGQHEHQSCLLLTSREQPQEIGRLVRGTTTVRSLYLTGLSLQASQELLHRHGLNGDAEEEITLIRRYSGHPLALMLVA
ncbi:MAG TPA: BTAD domain-containing putative transcriptional regulator, partial [Caldilineaceae bacterium]|nr:BTAD domain-containing putative transcriptional regulator [Caldilineaceae bacterium]